MYSINDQKSAVREIQRFLNSITRAKGKYPCVVEDGIYDNTTRECVRAFQRDNFLNATGVVDYETFLSLFNEYRLSIKIAQKCVLLLPDKLEGSVVQKGEESAVVSIIQALLKTFKVMYQNIGEIDISGVFDSETEKAVMEIQKVYSLTQNGIIDINTWNAIVSEYVKFRNSDM